MKKKLTVFLKISTIANELFDRKTGEELERIRDHFGVVYNEAQLCALVIVGMILRVFKLAPEPEAGSRSVWIVVGLLLEFFKNLDRQTARSGPNPLDDMVDQGLKQFNEE